MVVALQMGEHRHASLGLDAGDEARAAARHDHVEVAVEAAEHGSDGGTIAHWHERNRRLGQAGAAQPIDEAGVDQARGMEALGAAAEDRGVAGLEAERAGVRGDRRAALEDDADHAERHCDALDDQAVGPLEAGEHPIDRIGQRRDRLEPRGDPLDTSGVENEAVDEGRRGPARRRLGDVAAVGGEDLAGPSAHAGGRDAQRPRAGGIRGGGERA